MLRFFLVKSNDEILNSNNEDTGLLKGTNVLKYLVEPWLNTNRLVCADSYFASVGCAEMLLKANTRFIGVVKTASRTFPQQYLNNIELSDKGEYSGVVSHNQLRAPDVMAFVWMDRE